MTEDVEDYKTLMPTERKSMWRTVEERKMSDLTRVLEWLERRQGKKKQTSQKQKISTTETTLRPYGKVEKKVLKKKQEAENQKTQQPGGPKKDASYSKLYGIDPKGKRMLMSGSYTKDAAKKSELDIKDAIALESQRSISFRRQSTVDPVLQDTMFSGRRVGILREWTSKTPDSAYERKLKSLMEKGTEPKIETIKMLKPEEVLSCRYLRLSKNNIRTLVKLCKDAGLNVDIHPHMVESEIDSKKIFDRRPSTSL